MELPNRASDVYRRRVDRERAHPRARGRGRGRSPVGLDRALLLFAGLFAVAICAYLAATYLIVEAGQRGDASSSGLPRPGHRRRIVAGLLAAVGLVVVRTQAPFLRAGMTARRLPSVALSAVGEQASLGAMVGGAYRTARVAAAVAVGAVLWGWRAAQWPYLVVPDLTAEAAAAPRDTVRLVAIGFTVGGALLMRSRLVLFLIFKTSGSAAEIRYMRCHRPIRPAAPASP